MTVVELLDKAENELKSQLQKVELLRKNQDAICFYNQMGETSRLTDDVIDKIGEVDIDDLFVDLWIVVKTPNGISILKKCEYFICNEDTNILYEGSYKACRDFIKV